MARLQLYRKFVYLCLCGRLGGDTHTHCENLIVLFRRWLHHDVGHFMHDWLLVARGGGYFNVVYGSFRWVGETRKRFVDVLEV